MKLIAKVILLSIIVVLSSCHKEVPPSVIDESRIVEVEVKCRTFDNSTKVIRLKVLDVTAESVKKLFIELFKNNFPIYAAWGYSNRNITGGTKASLHAYGVAIDINEYLNPYYDVLKGSSSIIPKRFIDKTKDEEKLQESLKSVVVSGTELKAIINSVIQATDSDDWFVNRGIFRKGMVTQKEATIFAKHGFTIWGGMWKQPMDFMHFQVPKKLAEHLAVVSKEEGAIIWANYLLITKWHLLLEKKIVKLPEAKREAIFIDHLNKCQLDDDYLSAADKKETTDLCVRDCKYKNRYIEKFLREKA